MNHYGIIVLIFAVAALHSCEAAALGGTCGPNKIWNNCGSACPLECGLPYPRPCTQQCVIGCQCIPGLYKHGNSCITFRQCPRKQTDNEQQIYNDLV